MADGVMLLRMLEPAVRPDGVAGRAVGAPPPNTSIESQTFEAILARTHDTSPDADRLESGAATALVSSDSVPNLLDGLSAVDQIENQGLRALIDSPHQTGSAAQAAGRTQI